MPKVTGFPPRCAKECQTRERHSTPKALEVCPGRICFRRNHVVFVDIFHDECRDEKRSPQRLVHGTRGANCPGFVDRKLLSLYSLWFKLSHSLKRRRRRRRRVLHRRASRAAFWQLWPRDPLTSQYVARSSRCRDFSVYLTFPQCTFLALSLTYLSVSSATETDAPVIVGKFANQILDRGNKASSTGLWHENTLPDIWNRYISGTFIC